jgi:hypothetical protein
MRHKRALEVISRGQVKQIVVRMIARYVIFDLVGERAGICRPGRDRVDFAIDPGSVGLM